MTAVVSQQCFTWDLSLHRAFLKNVSLERRTVVDFGIGHGELTELALGHGAEKVIGFERDPKLRTPMWGHVDVEVHIEDFTSLSAEMKTPYRSVVIAYPPSETLGYLFGLFKRRQISDVAILVPEKYEIPNGYYVFGALTGEAFSPISRSGHLLIYKGIRDASSA